MKKKFSSKWKSSKQPRKQRKYRHNAPLHTRQRMVSSHLSPDLKKAYGKRSLPLRRGDEVLVITGEHSGRKSKVERIDLKSMKALLVDIKRKKATGQEVHIPLDPSNLMIVNADTSDKRRMKKVRRIEAKEEKKEKRKQEPKEGKKEEKGTTKEEKQEGTVVAKEKKKGENQ